MSYKNYDYLFKLLLIGDTGVGKTSMLTRFSDDVYDDRYISTIGVDFKIQTIEIENNIIKLQIWDTAGQERFRTITSSYYRGVHGIIIAFDITNYQSFENVNMWLQEIERYANKDINCLLIGCKSDLESDRKVSYNEANEYANSLNMPYIEVSAKYTHNIYYVFDVLARDILSRVIKQNEINKINKSENIILSATKPVKQNGTCC